MPVKKIKSKKKSKNYKKAKKDEKYCDDKNFDEKLIVIKIEHCKKCFVFKEQAELIYRKICENLADQKFKLILNNFGKDEPRDGAFEIVVCKNCRQPGQLVWSGFDRGPLRRDKFPTDMSKLLIEIEKIIE